MLANAMDAIRKDRAKFARDIEYVKEAAKDEVIDKRLEVAESQYFSETTEELEEAANWVDRLNVDDEEQVAEAEVQRILEATEDITFDEMIGIKSTTEVGE